MPQSQLRGIARPPSQRRQGLIYKYSRWDGTQKVDFPDAADAVKKIADEMLGYGNFQSALREMMQRGMKLSNGRQMMGMQELLEKLRKQQVRQNQRGETPDFDAFMKKWADVPHGIKSLDELMAYM